MAFDLLMTRALRTAPLLLLCMVACKKDGDTPAYVRVSTPKVISAAGNDTITSKITDLWIYANSAPAGVWEVGTRTPVIASGPTEVKIIAGVRKDGITDARVQYPFYATWSGTVDLVPGKVTDLAPVFSYYPDLLYWIEDMSGGGISLDTVNCTAPLVRYTTSDSSYAGCVLSAAEDVFRCENSGDALPIANGATAFMELDYRTDVTLLIGARYKISDVQFQVPYLYLAPTLLVDNVRQWNKVYVDLGTALSATGATDKRFYIEAVLPDGSSTGRVDLDNIRVIW